MACACSTVIGLRRGFTQPLTGISSQLTPNELLTLSNPLCPRHLQPTMGAPGGYVATSPLPGLSTSSLRGGSMDLSPTLWTSLMTRICVWRAPRSILSLWKQEMCRKHCSCAWTTAFATSRHPTRAQHTATKETRSCFHAFSSRVASAWGRRSWHGCLNGRSSTACRRTSAARFSPKVASVAVGRWVCKRTGWRRRRTAPVRRTTGLPTPYLHASQILSISLRTRTSKFWLCARSMRGHCSN
mmetsp:Transcript_43415/g.94284  ORF Transcript_43415/g.94284 Transcript_43415/m.94284 type:complete len:242 (-) Transcript_43415:508-1233(-)